MLTPEQRTEFDQRGVVRLTGAIPRHDADEMCDSVWDMLGTRHQIRRDAPESWDAQRIMGTHDLSKSMTFEKVGSHVVCEALDDLLGSNWQRPERWGSLLVTFPESRGRWDVPHQAWHLDFPASSSVEDLFVVRLFTCLAELPNGGGGTVFVAGSHRLVRDALRESGAAKLRSADARKALIRNHPWIKALCSLDRKVERVQQFMNTAGMADGVEVQVVEMTGKAGDVFLVHPLMMHAPARNCAAVPRLVLSSFVYRAGVNPMAPYQ